MFNKHFLCVLIAAGMMMTGCSNTDETTSHLENTELSSLQNNMEETDTETENMINLDSKEETENLPEENSERDNEYSLEEDIPEERNSVMNDMFRKNQMELGITMLKRQAEKEYDKNILISPLSLSTALAMTANGSAGATRNQMVQFFGQDIDSLNEDLVQYMSGLPSSDSNKMLSANSLWIKQTDGLTVKDEFLTRAEELYHAEIFQEPFSPDTVSKINQWVSKNTEQMIPDLIEKIDEDTVMYLINALAFDAQWQTPYLDDQISEDIFTSFDGTEQTVSMMTNSEGIFLDDGHSTGFMKPYANNDYSFVAFLPNENTDIRNYLNTLNAETILNILDNPEYQKVTVSLPAFEIEYSAKMKDTLQNMGMADAFSQSADFSGITDQNNIFINDVLHKTYISVDKNGTKAAAATAVEMMLKSAIVEEESKEIIFNRPFLYMIVDNQSHLPLFMGITVSSFE